MLNFREMNIDDYEAAYALWSETEGMVLSEADSRPSIGAYLERNPCLSFVCYNDQELAGTILGGHDGRRGYIYHVAVGKAHRNQGIGGELVNRSLAGLRQAGIMKCHLFVLEGNEIGNRFWDRSGWTKRDGILLYSKDT